MVRIIHREARPESPLEEGKKGKKKRGQIVMERDFKSLQSYQDKAGKC